MGASCCVFFFLIKRPPPRSSLFPHTTLFRSEVERQGRARHGLGPPTRADLVLAVELRQPLEELGGAQGGPQLDRKSTRLNSSHANISYAVFCLKKKIINDKHISL